MRFGQFATLTCSLPFCVIISGNSWFEGPIGSRKIWSDKVLPGYSCFHLCCWSCRSPHLDVNIYNSKQLLHNKKGATNSLFFESYYLHEKHENKVQLTIQVFFLVCICIIKTRTKLSLSSNLRILSGFM
jgi:hypothetical protein